MGLGAVCRVQGVGCRVLTDQMWGVGCKVTGFGCRVQDVGCRVKGLGCRVQGVRFSL